MVPALIEDLQHRGAFPSSAALWCYLKVHGVAEEHHRGLKAFSKGPGSGLWAVAVVCPPAAFHAERWAVFSIAGAELEELEGFNEHLHNNFRSGRQVLCFSQPEGDSEPRQGI